MENPLYGLTTYSYHPLKGPRSFRLLRFISDCTNSHHIHCHFEEFDRGSDQCPQYTALSYAWGDVQTTAPITLNGRLSFVTENLREALVYLKRNCPNILLWVDALSINQEDPNERGHQVSQMRAIYSDASSVISWLGPGSTDTARMFSFIDRHHNSCTNDSEPAGSCNFLFDRVLADAVQYLEGRPYWNRIWVIQEIVVAMKLELMCGDQFISWPIFAAFWDLIFDDHFKKAQGMNRRIAPPIYASAILPVGSWRRTDISLSYAIERTGRSHATDSRDRIYAVLGLVDKGAGQNITVDYKISPCAVYLVATKALIEDWKDDNDPITSRQDRLEDLRARIDTMIIARRNYGSLAPDPFYVECKATMRMLQHVRFLLCHTRKELNVPMSDEEVKSNCNGEKCGSWAAMWKAATIHRSFDPRWESLV
jgi:hypothetical protein